MSIFNGLNISSSALTAQRLRMDVVASNIANAQTTRATLNEAGQFEPYRRKLTEMHTQSPSFRSFLHKAKHSYINTGNGVKVTRIVEDDTPFKVVFDPTHPDANDAGFVEYPNVDPLKEMVDLMEATRSYEANMTSLNATKDMLLKTLEIGK